MGKSEVKIGFLTRDEIEEGDIYLLDPSGMELDDLVARIVDNQLQHVVAPYRTDDTQWSTKVLINLRQRLWRQGVEVVGVVIGKGKQEKKEYAQWLDLNGFSGIWLHGDRWPGTALLWELEQEGVKLKKAQYIETADGLYLKSNE